MIPDSVLGGRGPLNGAAQTGWREQRTETEAFELLLRQGPDLWRQIVGIVERNALWPECRRFGGDRLGRIRPFARDISGGVDSALDDRPHRLAVPRYLRRCPGPCFAPFPHLRHGTTSAIKNLCLPSQIREGAEHTSIGRTWEVVRDAHAYRPVP